MDSTDLAAKLEELRQLSAENNVELWLELDSLRHQVHILQALFVIGTMLGIVAILLVGVFS